MKYRQQNALIFLGLLLSSCGGGSSFSLSLVDSSPGTSSAAPRLTLTYADEFEGSKLSDDWSYLHGNGAEVNNPGWGNNELEYYQENNAVVKDGFLSIVAKKENVTTDEGHFSYTSARIRTKGKVATTYGRIEARISLPAIEGTWPAFWMLPEKGSWPVAGEIDIMENGGTEVTTSGALHYSSSSGTGAHAYRVKYHNYGGNQWGKGTTKDFHVYAVEWTEEQLDFYVDDDMFMSVPKRVWHPDSGKAYETDDDAPFNKDFHILLNMAIGGNYVGDAIPPDDFSSCEMKVDYVRNYRINY